jgi:AcrR family transcriptional regulator
LLARVHEWPFYFGVARKAAKRPRARGVELEWVKPAQQDRSRDTHARIIAAAERLLSRGRSWSELSVAELVAEADASVGAFYNRFRDKDALLHVLQLDLHAQGVATAERAAALAGSALPLDALVRAFVTVAVASYRDQRGLRRALLVEMWTNAVFRERSIELSRLTCAGLVGVLAPHVKGKDTDRLATVIDVAHRIVYGTLDQMLLYDDQAPTGRKIADPQLTEELTLACLGYLERSLPLRP